MSPEGILIRSIKEQFGRSARRPLVVGLCGAQGSGKSTLSEKIAEVIPHTATLSLDDLYMPRSERRRLAETVHPLLATRGPPGTHDVGLGLETFMALAAGEPTSLPRFDKSVDDRAPTSSWPLAPRNCKLLIFEGWCVGAAPQNEADLADPLNELERSRDGDGRWRRYVNATLASQSYRSLFAIIDFLVLLAAPSRDIVLSWRLQQEHELRRRALKGSAVMDDAQVARFVEHYERLTRHVLQEMPTRGHLVLRLAADRNCVAVDTPRGDASG